MSKRGFNINMMKTSIGSNHPDDILGLSASLKSVEKYITKIESDITALERSTAIHKRALEILFEQALDSDLNRDELYHAICLLKKRGIQFFIQQATAEITEATDE